MSPAKSREKKLPSRNGAFSGRWRLGRPSRISTIGIYTSGRRCWAAVVSVAIGVESVDKNVIPTSCIVSVSACRECGFGLTVSVCSILPGFTVMTIVSCRDNFSCIVVVVSSATFSDSFCVDSSARSIESVLV